MRISTRSVSLATTALSGFLLWAGMTAPAHADAALTALIRTFTPTNLWPLEVDGTDVVAGENMTTTGTVTFGLTLATHSLGFHANNSSSKLEIPSVNLTPSVCSISALDTTVQASAPCPGSLACPAASAAASRRKANTVR